MHHPSTQAVGIFPVHVKYCEWCELVSTVLLVYLVEIVRTDKILSPINLLYTGDLD